MAAPGLLVVAIDDKTFDDLGRVLAVPALAPRAGHRPPAQRRRRGRSSTTSSSPSRPTPREDNALIDAVGARAQRRAGHGRDRRARQQQRARRRRATSRRLGARAGASNLPPGPGGVLQRFDASAGGLRDARGGGRPPGRPRAGAAAPSTTAARGSTSAARRARSTPSRSRTSSTAASIPRSCAAGSSSWAPRRRRCRTSTRPRRPRASSCPGPEIEANAIYTATHGLPLRDAPRLGRPAGHPRPRPAARAGQPAPARAAGRAARARRRRRVARRRPARLRPRPRALGRPRRSSRSRLGTVATIAAGYLAERRAPPRFAERNEALEEAVHERTAELRETQLEIIHRLAAADRVARRGDRAAPRAHRPALRARRRSCSG